MKIRKRITKNDRVTALPARSVHLSVCTFCYLELHVQIQDIVQGNFEVQNIQLSSQN